MVVYDARPSSFTQLSSITEWEALWSAAAGKDAVDGSGSFVASFDVPGRNIVISAGSAAIRGQLWRADAPVSTPIPAASAQNRIDRLVLRYNRGATTSPTVIQPTVITGTPSGSPVIPPLVQTPTGLWDFPVCFWASQSTGGLVTLTDNRTLIVNDTWHSISPPANWFGGVNYKMNDDKTVSLAGLVQLNTSGGYNGVVIATLPTIYSPLGDKRMPIVCTAQSSVYGQNIGTGAGLPYVWVNTSGQVQLGGLPGSINSQIVYLDGARYALDF